MAYAEKYVKPVSAAWANATVYAADAQVVGSDGLNYYCISAHTSETGVKGRPIDGTSWATYWAVADGTTAVRAWNLEQAIAAGGAAAGDRVNILKGSYSLTANRTLPNGSITAPIQWRGYNSTIGDLETAAWSTVHTAAGFLDTTNFPAIACGSYAWSTGTYTRMSCLNLSFDKINNCINLYNGGAAGTDMLFRCKVLNVNTGSSWLMADPYHPVHVVDCDLFTAGSGCHWDNASMKMVGCRLVGGTSAYTTNANGGVQLFGCLFADITGTVLAPGTTAAQPFMVINCTFDGCSGTCVAIPNSALSYTSWLFVNNQFTNCGKAFDNLRTATQAVVIDSYNNRLRDNTNTYVGFFDAGGINDLTTDDTDANDYVDRANDDWRLKSTAMGRDKGVPPCDTGWYQIAPPTLPPQADVWSESDTYGYADAMIAGLMSYDDITNLVAENIKAGVWIGNEGILGTYTGSGGVIVVEDD